MYQDWQVAQQRLTMAQQSLHGAEKDATAKQARFEGAVELLGGKTAKWTFSPDDGVSVTERPEIEDESELASNGQPPTDLSVVTSNRQARRAAKKALGK